MFFRHFKEKQVFVLYVFLPGHMSHSESGLLLKERNAPWLQLLKRLGSHLHCWGRGWVGEISKQKQTLNL